MNLQLFKFTNLSFLIKVTNNKNYEFNLHNPQLCCTHSTSIIFEKVIQVYQSLFFNKQNYEFNLLISYSW